MDFQGPEKLKIDLGRRQYAFDAQLKWLLQFKHESMHQLMDSLVAPATRLLVG